MNTAQLPAIASLCAGYGGLEQGVADAIGGAHLTWYSEIEPAASRLLEHHHPGILNVGDLTVADWSALDHPEVFTAGFPCQPFSLAGQRAGADDERHLWPYIAKGAPDPDTGKILSPGAIASLRPRMFVGENVRGLLTLGLDQVLADLRELDYDVRWVVAKASDLVLACHGRPRLFFVATDRHQAGRIPRPGGQPIACHAEDGWREPNDGLFGPVPFSGRIPAAGLMVDGDLYEAEPPAAATWSAPLLPTPRTSDTTGPGVHGNGGLDLRTAIALLPTPRASDGTKGGPNQRGSSGDLMLPSAAVNLPDAPADWGVYDQAVRRWAREFGRPAPAPTMTGQRGGPQLAPALPEWMMGLPEGHITAVSGLSRAEQIKLAGNGVMPQHCTAAVRWLLGESAVAGSSVLAA